LAASFPIFEIRFPSKFENLPPTFTPEPFLPALSLAPSAEHHIAPPINERDAARINNPDRSGEEDEEFGTVLE